MKMPPPYAAFLLASSALSLVLSTPALAQTLPPTSPSPPSAQTVPVPPNPPKPNETRPATKPGEVPATGSGEAIETVTVTAARPITKIDRDVYDPKTDPDTPVSSAADALNKAPGVNVDPDGNVTLRGNSGVQILIDGKPSTMMQGDFRALSLQSLPADDIDSIEVMTSPSAQFGGEGGAGIINIVMKRNRSLRPTLGLRVSAGSEGRYQFGANGSYGKGKVMFNGGVSVNHDVRDTSGTSSRQRISPTGTSVYNTANTSRQTTDTGGMRGAVTINATDRDTLSLQFNASKNQRENETLQSNVDISPLGVQTNSYDRRDDARNAQDQGGLQFNFNHQGDQDGETFKADVRLSSSENTSRTLSDYSYVNPAQDRRTLRNGVSSQDTLALSADYNRNLLGGTFATGFELSSSHSEADNAQYNIDLSSGAQTIDARRSNTFGQDQDQAEAYVTYQRAIGDKWTVLTGLRAENTQVTLNQKTTSTYLNKSYTNYHPSLAVQYMLTARSKLRFNYSHRINRPNINDLNPYIVYYDERNARSGNADLKPSETHSNELRYEFNDRARNLTFTATYFYRKSEDLFVERSLYIDNNTVLLTRRENGGEGKENGVELMYNGRIGTKWDVNLQATYRQEERPPVNSTLTTINKGDSVSGRLRLGYRATANDRFQLNLNAQGRQLTGQGYNDPSYRWNASYSRKISNKLNLTASVQNQGKQRTLIDTDTVKSVSERDQGGTTFMIGLQFNPFGIGGGNRDGGARPGGRGGGNWGGGPGGGF
ncbi:TonB-dependent receptor [Asticcacaulis sp. DW145]|uniref:TonB-dependent receptor n=1 Tax=Asticcacaulis sp. DW145 TaxID=3095608 RepID=UPI0030928425|nr:TonB-dependent receptor [Asticcacaulis sp. DW145]